MKTIPRHHYNPTPEQRVEVLLAVHALKHRIARNRARREAVKAFGLLGWSDSAAGELAQIHVEGGAA